MWWPPPGGPEGLRIGGPDTEVASRLGGLSSSVVGVGGVPGRAFGLGKSASAPAAMAAVQQRHADAAGTRLAQAAGRTEVGPTLLLGWL